jgi:hypothetical protein
MTLSIWSTNVIRSACLLSCAAVLVMGKVGGNGPVAQELGCNTDELTRLTLSTIRSASRDVQTKAATSFLQNWSSSLPGLLNEIAQIKPSQLNKMEPAELQWVILVTDLVKAMLASNDQAIRLFRQCPIRQTAIKILAWAARGENTPLRLSAANILANVVDNTTVCFVLPHLRDATISTAGRANLLGVTRAMASYAYRENSDAISAALERINAIVANSREDLRQTRSLIVDISDRLQRSPNRNAALPTALGELCRGFTITDQPDPI